MRFFKKKSDSAPKDHLKRELQPYLKALSQLEDSMDRLLREHPVAATLDDFFDYIHVYSGRSLSPAEYDYCKDIIKRRVYKGMGRYDDERLRD